MMPLPLVPSLLLFLLITVLGSPVQPKDLHKCYDPKKNVGNVTMFCNMKGHFLNISNVCQKCSVPDNTTMVVGECSPTQDAVFQCIRPNEYVALEIDGDRCKAACKKCRLCGVGLELFKIHEMYGTCHGYLDRICCASEDEILVNDECVDPLKTTTTTTSNKSTKEELHDAVSESSVSFASKNFPSTELTLLMILRLVFLDV